jgi:chromate reductase, NAD(P)H dehydrogenase (quinone)
MTAIGETEHGLPERARALKALIAEHHALLIATPSTTAAILRSRRTLLIGPAARLKAIPLASKCLLGGSRPWSRRPPAIGRNARANRAPDSLNELGLLVIPNSFALGLADQAFDEKWLLKDANADRVSVGSTRRLSRRPALLPQSRITVSAGPIERVKISRALLNAFHNVMEVNSLSCSNSRRYDYDLSSRVGLLALTPWLSPGSSGKLSPAL